MYGRLRGQSRAEVEKIGDATLAGRAYRRGHDERPVAARPFIQARVHAQQLPGEFPIGGEVVLPARLLP
jgi:hypothetical protein